MSGRVAPGTPPRVRMDGEGMGRKAPSSSQRGARHGKGMLAGAVAQALGVGVQTLHYYERESLIPAVPRSAAGYRIYPPELVDRLRFIRKAQAFGLTLGEIRDVLEMAEQGTCPCGHVKAVFVQKLTEVDRRLRELHEFRSELAALVERSADVGARMNVGQICAIVEGTPGPLASFSSAAPIMPRSGERDRWDAPE